MKKTYRLFSMVCMAGAMAFLASSCKKNENTESIQITLPEFEEVMVEPIDAGKAYIDFQTNGTFRWRDGDTVMFYNIDNAGQKTRKAYYIAPEGSEGATRTRFTSGYGAAMGDRMDHFFVFYPVNKIVNGLDFTPGIENREYFEVPMVQNYTKVNGHATVDPQAMAMAAETYSVEGGVTLHHIFGVVRMVVKSTDATAIQRVKRIELIDNTYNLNGTVSMKLHKVDMERFDAFMTDYTWETVGASSSFFTAWSEYNRELCYESYTDEDHNGTGYTVALNCVTPETPEGVKIVQGASDDPDAFIGQYTNFYISVRPGALINGFTMKVYHDDAVEPIVISDFANPSTTALHNAYCVRAGQISFFGIQNGLENYMND